MAQRRNFMPESIDTLGCTLRSPRMVLSHIPWPHLPFLFDTSRTTGNFILTRNLMQEHSKRHIVSKYDDLTLFRQLHDSSGNRLTLHMIEGRNRIIENKSRLACVKVHLGEEASEAKCRLFTLGKDILKL